MNSHRNVFPPSPTIIERIKGVPKLADFVERVEKIASLDDPEMFWQCEPYFRELVQSNFLTDVLNYELTRFVNEEDYMPDGTSKNEITIVRKENLGLTMKILEPTMTLPNRLYSSTEHYMVSVADFAGTGVATLETFEQPDAYPNEAFKQKKRAVYKGGCTLKPGDVSLFRAPETIFRVLPPEKPLILIVFSSRTLVPLRWQYDSSTLLPTRIIAADLMSSRLEYTASMLSEIGDETSIPALKALVEHYDHFVRWAAIRSVTRLDFMQGVKLLHIALEDPHPHIRNAAQRSLDKLPA